MKKIMSMVMFLSLVMIGLAQGAGIEQDGLDGRTIVTISGYNGNAALSTSESVTAQSAAFDWDIWDVLESAEGGTVTVSSGSAVDVDSSVYIAGLTYGFATTEETIAMNGQTAVTSQNKYFRINDFYVSIGDTNGVQPNEGIIYAGRGTVTSGVPAAVIAQIPAMEGRMSGTVFTTKANFNLYITDFNISTTQAVLVSLRTRDYTAGIGSSGGAWTVRAKYLSGSPKAAIAITVPA